MTTAASDAVRKVTHALEEALSTADSVGEFMLAAKIDEALSCARERATALE